MFGSRALSGSAILTLLAQPLMAADCPIERAIYAEVETKSELHFRAASGDNTPVSHGFSLIAKSAANPLDGHVIYDPDIERPVAMIMNNCPEGDVTGADLAACTVWKGIIYSADKTTGHIDLLPPEGSGAPDSLLLPGFGPAYAQSSFGKSLETAPWDVFEFKGCAS
ncbi:hypothetical protein PDO_2441 [Rhizobium sp. PDO1-076]|uniref:hypothetical protein n=1 Tax=Rhizobium sp. PDO1-076 TaxID=1125979 RepID=UPI00024E25FE|nr:hypothetical protein [Rhizobium sp. PDO1-076]EHS50487.1 hypothetical protein PDO_2441 [Rhizobium sp. PDO1-076]